MREQKIQGFISDFIKVFSQYGLDGASLKKLAQEADMTESLIYRYFENKDDLIRNCVNKYHPQLQQELTQVMIDNLDQRDELAARILEYIDGVIDVCRFLLQVVAHPYYSTMTDATSADIEQQIVRCGEALAEQTGMDRDKAIAVSNLLNSIVNDYILKKSRDNFYRQYEIIMSMLEDITKV